MGQLSPNCSRDLPQPYAGATYEILEQGTWVNETMYQITAKCTGCTSWTDPDSGQKVVVAPTGDVEMAWAYAIHEPEVPASNTSFFTFHDAQGVYNNNLTDAGNADFVQRVEQNRLPATPRVVPENGTCLYTKPEIPDDRVTVTKTETTTVTEASMTITAIMTVTDAGATATVTVTAGTGCGSGGATVTSTTTVVPTNCPAVTKPAEHHWY